MDISLYKDESQIEKKSPGKRKSNENVQKSLSSAAKRKKSGKTAAETPQKKEKQSISKKSPAKVRIYDYHSR